MCKCRAHRSGHSLGSHLGGVRGFVCYRAKVTRSWAGSGFRCAVSCAVSTGPCSEYLLYKHEQEPFIISPELFIKISQMSPELFINFSQMSPELFINFSQMSPGLFIIFSQMSPELFINFSQMSPELFINFSQMSPELFINFSQMSPELFINFSQMPPELFINFSKMFPELFIYIYIILYIPPCQLRGGAVQPFCSEETACIASSSTKWMCMHDRISLLNVGPWFSWSAKFGYIFRMS